MMLLNDKQIKKYAQEGMISDFVDEQVSTGVVSYGLSSFGYDMRVGNRWAMFDSPLKHPNVHDPKLPAYYEKVEFYGSEIVLQPGAFALAESYEHFCIPDTVMVLVVGKSTYARLGIIVNVTPLEPEWSGCVTIEISNTNTVPVRIYAEEGIAQCLFFEGERPRYTYKERNGRYNNQTGISYPFVRFDDTTS